MLVLGLIDSGGAGRGLYGGDGLPPLPGPGYDFAVDVDGDGVATWNDQWAFTPGLTGRLRPNTACVSTDTTAATPVSMNLPTALAIGSFAGLPATFGVYVASTGDEMVHRLDAVSAATFGFADFSAFDTDTIGAAAFDPFAPKLFLADDNGQIYRVRFNGALTLFGDCFDRPRGISFHPRTAAMLVSEDDRLTVVDGWRFRFRRGDANGDGAVDVSDPTYIANFLFLGGPPPPCWDAADSNDSGVINLTDVTFLTNFISLGGPAPPAPGPSTCGTDPTIDLFGCGEYRSTAEPSCTVDP